MPWLLYLLIFISVLLGFSFGNSNTEVKFQFLTSDGLFNHQRFKSKTLTPDNIICDLLFIDIATLVITILRQTQELSSRF